MAQGDKNKGWGSMSINHREENGEVTKEEDRSRTNLLLCLSPVDCHKHLKVKHMMHLVLARATNREAAAITVSGIPDSISGGSHRTNSYHTITRRSA